VQEIRQGYHRDLHVVALQRVLGIGECQPAVGFGKRGRAICIGIRDRDQASARCGSDSAGMRGAGAAGTVDDNAQ